MALLLLAAFIGLFLGSVGIYGVISYIVWFAAVIPALRASRIPPAVALQST